MLCTGRQLQPLQQVELSQAPYSTSSHVTRSYLSDALTSLNPLTGSEPGTPQLCARKSTAAWPKSPLTPQHLHPDRSIIGRAEEPIPEPSERPYLLQVTFKPSLEQARPTVPHQHAAVVQASWHLVLLLHKHVHPAQMAKQRQLAYQLRTSPPHPPQLD
jgi:hypothetical protein